MIDLSNYDKIILFKSESYGIVCWEKKKVENELYIIMFGLCLGVVG